MEPVTVALATGAAAVAGLAVYGLRRLFRVRVSFPGIIPGAPDEPVQIYEGHGVQVWLRVTSSSTTMGASGVELPFEALYLRARWPRHGEAPAGRVYDWHPAGPAADPLRRHPRTRPVLDMARERSLGATMQLSRNGRLTLSLTSIRLRSLPPVVERFAALAAELGADSHVRLPGEDEDEVAAAGGERASVAVPLD